MGIVKLIWFLEIILELVVVISKRFEIVKVIKFWNARWKSWSNGSYAVNRVKYNLKV